MLPALVALVLSGVLAAMGWLAWKGIREGDRPGDIRWRLLHTAVLEEDPLLLIPVLVFEITNPSQRPAHARIWLTSPRRPQNRSVVPRGHFAPQTVNLAPRSSSRIVVPLSTGATIRLGIRQSDGRQRVHRVSSQTGQFALRHGGPEGLLRRQLQPQHEDWDQRRAGL